MSEKFSIFDRNEWLVDVPKDFEPCSLVALGAYLRADYVRTTSDGFDYLHVFLNTDGREVARTSQHYVAPPVVDWGRRLVEPLAWYEKVWLWFQVTVLRRA